MKHEQPGQGEEQEYPHWNRVYFAVVIYTTALITVLWLFSKQFQ